MSQEKDHKLVRVPEIGYARTAKRGSDSNGREFNPNGPFSGLYGDAMRIVEHVDNFAPRNERGAQKGRASHPLFREAKARDHGPRRAWSQEYDRDAAESDQPARDPVQVEAPPRE